MTNYWSDLTLYYCFQSLTQQPSLDLDIPESSPQDDDCDTATPEKKVLKVQYIGLLRGAMCVCDMIFLLLFQTIIDG